uniref:Signal peptidase complex subunit 1 n=1 Tax=Albugo laibachii Nc14 TaxID=890382 RepID=F0W1A3_9STRA|nr:hypothetical protein PITG_05628 [Albugo laibachii Nc14]|eukprot:CCA14830.1 hypothetical protein PITG_05628 [Albugo laibachii Nc14]
MVDYKGQILAERYAQLCFAIICAPAWLYGYYEQDFTYPLYAWAAASVVATLVALPDWGIYNRNPIRWKASLLEEISDKNGKEE